MSYLTRAMKSRNPRFSRIFEKMGYDTKPMVAAETAVEAPVDDLADLRAEYGEVVGKRPFMGWDAETLREKIAAAKAGG